MNTFFDLLIDLLFLERYALNQRIAHFLRLSASVGLHYQGEGRPDVYIEKQDRRGIDQAGA